MNEQTKKLYVKLVDIIYSGDVDDEENPLPNQILKECKEAGLRFAIKTNQCPVAIGWDIKEIDIEEQVDKIGVV